VAGSEELQLQHLYRAMAWLGETLETDDDERTTRSTKDVVEERLFDRRRNLFDDLELVLMDTTSLFFYGEGGAELGPPVLGMAARTQAADPGGRRRPARPTHLLGDLAGQHG